MKCLGKTVLESARARGVAIGGFDAFNMESALSVVNAANALSAPVFLQAGVLSAEYMGLDMACHILREAKKTARVEICAHLDHGPDTSDIDQLKQAMNLGFESVMVDGSALSLEENISLTRKIVEMAHPRGIGVEGEVGRVSRNVHAAREEVARFMTDPEQAARFVEETKVDYLAVSVGSVSGFYRGDLHLDLERPERISNKVPIPLGFPRRDQYPR